MPGLFLTRHLSACGSRLPGLSFTLPLFPSTRRITCHPRLARRAAQERKGNMLGEKIGETTGKITGQRTLPLEGSVAKIESSQLMTGKMLGVEVTEIGTYWSTLKEGGILYGEGQGILMTEDGESCVWKGAGTGKPTGKGLGVTYRGAIYYDTKSSKLARLNATCVVFEYEVDEQ